MRPPPPPTRAFGPAREAILVELGADRARRDIAERIAAQQTPHVRFSAQQLVDQAYEPGLVFDAAQRREPHLPVEPVVVRGDHAWAPAHVARFAFELVL